MFNSFPSIQFLICVIPNLVRCSRWKLFHSIISDFFCQAFFKTFFQVFSLVGFWWFWKPFTRMPAHYITSGLACQAFSITFFKFFSNAFPLSLLRIFCWAALLRQPNYYIISARRSQTFFNTFFKFFESFLTNFCDLTVCQAFWSCSLATAWILYHIYP